MRNLYTLGFFSAASCESPCEGPTSIAIVLETESPLIADYQRLLYLDIELTRTDTNESFEVMSPLQWTGKGSWQIQEGSEGQYLFDYPDCQKWYDGAWFPYEITFSLQYEDGELPETGSYPPQTFAKDSRDIWQAELWDGFVLSVNLW